MPFAAAWMNLEINILMEVDRKRKTIFLWYHPYVDSKRNVSMKQEQTHRHREQACGCQGGKDWELRMSRWNLFIHRIDKEWGPTVWHREIYSVSWHKSEWKRIYMLSWINLLYGRNELYFNTLFLIFKNLYVRQQKRCVEQFFGLWERARVGWFGRMPLKHV